MSNEQCCELLASNLWMRWCLGGMPESLVIPKRSEESAFLRQRKCCAQTNRLLNGSSPFRNDKTLNDKTL